MVSDHVSDTFDYARNDDTADVVLLRVPMLRWVCGKKFQL